MLSILQRGEVFQATLRVNAHNRLEVRRVFMQYFVYLDLDVSDGN